MDKLTQLRKEQGDIQKKIDDLAIALDTEKRGFSEAEKTDLTTWKARLSEIESEAKPLQELQEMRGKAVAPVTFGTSKPNEEKRELAKY